MKKNVLLLFLGAYSLSAAAQTLTIKSGGVLYTNSTTGTPTLNIAGGLQNEGTLVVEGGISSTSLTISNGTLTVPISGAAISTGYDQLAPTGTVTLTGSTLTVTLSGGYVPTIGTTFTIVDAGTTLSGTFTTVNYPTLPSDRKWGISYNNAAGTVILSVSSSVLPVELLDFKATPKANNSVGLDWATALELNTRDFTLERSRDGRAFTPLSTIKPKGTNSTYGFTDNTPFVGVNYYRLTIHDLDGKTSYSKIVAVVMGDKTFKVKAYPSLVGAALTLTTDGGEIADFQIVNLAGQVVMRQNKNDQSAGGFMQVNMGALPSGVYLVTAQNTEGVATTVKIVKQ